MGVSRNRTQCIESAAHHLYHYATENLLTMDGLIWTYVASTLTPQIEANRLSSQCLTLITIFRA